MDTVVSGYFDDLGIGNFMKTQLHNTRLYPDFTPLAHMLERFWGYRVEVAAAAVALRLGAHEFLKDLKRNVL